jgi:hypothetical protein
MPWVVLQPTTSPFRRLMNAGNLNQFNHEADNRLSELLKFEYDFSFPLITVELGLKRTNQS